MYEIIQAAFLIFVAELGDKTQIMAMSFATKYKVRDILLGVGLGVVLNHGIAVFIGAHAQRFIPIVFIQLLAALLFIIFGYTSLKVEEEDEDSAKSIIKSAIITVALAFFLGEMGDKTQLTAMALAINGNPISTLIGTTTGMILTSGVGIVVGMYFGKHIPEKWLKLFSGMVFVVLGIQKLRESLLNYDIDETLIYVVQIAVAVIYVLLAIRFVYKKKYEDTAYKKSAERLYELRLYLKKYLYESCSNGMQCSSCKEQGCLLSAVYKLLEKTIKGEETIEISKNISLNGDYKKEKVEKGLVEILKFRNRWGWNNEPEDVKNIRYVFEKILFEDSIEEFGNIEMYFEKLYLRDPKLCEIIKTKVRC
jgi:putative Ca2+/H+ antiporter (TMEM165/GDT1 family)